MRRTLAVVVVPVLMVLVAVAHGVRVANYGENPWVGAGFGMFAEIDGPQRTLTFIDGDDVITVPSYGSEEWARLSNFPSDAALEQFAGRNGLDALIVRGPLLGEDGAVTWEEVAAHGGE